MNSERIIKDQREYIEELRYSIKTLREIIALQKECIHKDHKQIVSKESGMNDALTISYCLT